MIHRLFLSSFAFLSLAMCQNQNVANDATTSSETSGTVKSNTSPSQPQTPATPQKETVPEMSDGLPPDKEATKTAEKEQSAMNNTAGIVYLKEGEQKFLKEYEMNVKFKGMVEDSRCPQGVNCVWAGAAVAEVELMGLATRPMTLKLSTTDQQGKGLSKTQDFNGYAITLAEVSPETTSAKGFKALKGSYKIGLRMKKGSGNPETQRGGTTTK